MKGEAFPQALLIFKKTVTCLLLIECPEALYPRAGLTHINHPLHFNKCFSSFSFQKPGINFNFQIPNPRVMKQVTFFAVFITVSQLSFARMEPAKNKVHAAGKNYGDTVLTAIPSPQQMLEEIISVTGLHDDFELKEADVLNIQASISHQKRYILYNAAYIDWLNKLTRDKWATMALLAHEVGHHLNGHTIRKGGSSPAVELEADEFAGFILQKLGATLEQSQEVMKYIAGLKASETHPGRMARMLAIQNGWDRAAVTEGTTTAANHH